MIRLYLHARTIIISQEETKESVANRRICFKKLVKSVIDTYVVNVIALFSMKISLFLRKLINNAIFVF